MFNESRTGVFDTRFEAVLGVIWAVVNSFAVGPVPGTESVHGDVFEGRWRWEEDGNETIFGFGECFWFFKTRKLIKNEPQLKY